MECLYLKGSLNWFLSVSGLIIGYSLPDCCLCLHDSSWPGQTILALDAGIHKVERELEINNYLCQTSTESGPPETVLEETECIRRNTHSDDLIMPVDSTV